MGRDASIEDRSCLIAARRRLEIEATHHLVDITGRKTLFGWRKSPPNGKYQEVFSFDDSDESPTFVSLEQAERSNRVPLLNIRNRALHDARLRLCGPQRQAFEPFDVAHGPG